MKRSTLVIFGVFAVIFVVVIPFWAISKEGGEGASPADVAESDQDAKALFQTNCGTCHTLAAAGTDGVVGPDLDDLLGQGDPEANSQRVVTAIENGVPPGGGRMPAGILGREAAQEVADWVGRVAGQ